MNLSSFRNTVICVEDLVIRNYNKIHRLLQKLPNDNLLHDNYGEMTSTHVLLLDTPNNKTTEQ